MWLFPYHRFVISTELSYDDAIQRITDITDNINIPVPGSLKFLRRANDFEKYFFGRIDKNVFKIHRAIKGRNSFLPFIKGEIIKSEEKTMIKIRMRIHPIFLIFCLWILIISCFDKSSFGHIVFIYAIMPAVFVLAIYAFALFSFRYDAQKDKETLLTIFDGEIAS